MRKFYIGLVGLVGLLFVIGGCASTSGLLGKSEPKQDIKAIMSETTTEIPVNIMSAGKTTIIFEDRGDRVYYTIINPLLTKKGDTKGKDLRPAAWLKIASGILDEKGLKPYFVTVEVKDGKAEFSHPNYARAEGVGVPVGEHLWGIGNTANGDFFGHLVLDSNDPLVCYETVTFGGFLTKSGERANLEKLAIGTMMYPDKPTIPLKSLGKGKLVQGKHPELK